MKRLTLACVLVGASLLVPTSSLAASCGDLARLALPQATVTTAAIVATGAFTLPSPAGRGGGAGAAAFARLPEFCRVAATVTPSSDSDIKIEVWLPTSGWNGKFQAVGNGGWAGSISYTALAQALAAGYAAASTDTGHSGNTASFVVGHPEKVIDLGYRAVHEMTAKAKAIVDAFYGAPPKLSIWNGCSQGGRQGITAAVRYPTDFDAVVAGAPAVNWMHLHAGRMAANRAANATPEATIPREKYALIHDAVLAACDAADGVADRVLENPMACRFDPAVLQCRAGQAEASCLTAPQVESVRSLYDPVFDRRKQPVLPGLVPGTELGWAVAAAPQPVATALDAFRYLLHQDATWDASRFDPAVDIDGMLRADRDDTLGSTSTDLKAFFDRGGKLLIYHGWSDAQVTPLNSIGYFEKVASRFGADVVGRSLQLYMAPGMNHCQGGNGPDQFDEVAAMEQWIASGAAPKRIIASRIVSGVVERTRPLCPYGQVAMWDGRNSTNDASSFACEPATDSPAR
jgi:feruloyl esterase